MSHKTRNDRLRKKLSEYELDGFLVTRPENILYLIGIQGIEGVYFVYQDGAVLFTDFRYFNLVKEKDHFFEIIQCKQWMKDIAEWLKKNGFRMIGCESSHLTLETHNLLQSAISPINLVPCPDLVENLRILKDKQEQELIRKSARILGEIMDMIPTLLDETKDITEQGLAIELDYMMKKAGAQRAAFDIIVATDQRAAFPHSMPTDHVIEKGNLLLVDCGAVYKGYHSDMTRVMAIQEPIESRIQEIYEIVRDAQKAALLRVSPGAPAKEIDLAAREIIKKAGFEECFGHGTGHGIGLMIHEGPKISMISEVVLEKGMIFTIEPGIYLEKEFGIRWEDMVLVTDDGYECLTDILWDSLEVL